jgi:hypothetical protein
MTWPPKVGEPLPRAGEATGVREKLIDYSLNTAHKRGRTKARGFERILGITIKDIDYLEATIREGILVMPVRSMRIRASCYFQCEVRVPIRGLGERRVRTVEAVTAWEFAHSSAAPRITTAYLRP